MRIENPIKTLFDNQLNTLLNLHPFDRDYNSLNKMHFLTYLSTQNKLPADYENEPSDYFHYFSNLLLSKIKENHQIATTLIELLINEITLKTEKANATAETNTRNANDDDDEIIDQTQTNNEKKAIALLDNMLQTILSEQPKLNPWQRTMINHFILSNPTPASFISLSDYEKYAQQFLTFIIKENSQWLPEQYSIPNKNISYAELMFPSSLNGRYPDQFAHIATKHQDAKIISSTAAYNKTRNQKNKAASLQSYLKMLWDLDVNTVVELGFDSDRLDYKNVQPTSASDYFHSKSQDENLFILNNTRENKTKNIQYFYFGVLDNTSMNLSDEELDRIKMIHNDYQSKNEKLLFHCSSGIGRTGQLNLLFSLLDRYHQDTAFYSKINILINSVLTLTTETDADYISQLHALLNSTLSKVNHIITESLHQLRQQRYTIQAPEQLTHTLVQLLLTIVEPQHRAKLRTSFNFEQNSASFSSIAFVESTSNTPGKETSIASQKKFKQLENSDISFSSRGHQQTSAHDSLHTTTTSQTSNNNSNTSLRKSISAGANETTTIRIIHSNSSLTGADFNALIPLNKTESPNASTRIHQRSLGPRGRVINAIEQSQNLGFQNNDPERQTPEDTLLNKKIETTLQRAHGMRLHFQFSGEANSPINEKDQETMRPTPHTYNHSSNSINTDKVANDSFNISMASKGYDHTLPGNDLPTAIPETNNNQPTSTDTNSQSVYERPNTTGFVFSEPTLRFNMETNAIESERTEDYSTNDKATKSTLKRAHCMRINLQLFNESNHSENENEAASMPPPYRANTLSLLKNPTASPSPTGDRPEKDLSSEQQTSDPINGNSIVQSSSYEL